jgi:hypothetical protein
MLFSIGFIMGAFSMLNTMAAVLRALQGDSIDCRLLNGGTLSPGQHCH